MDLMMMVERGKGALKMAVTAALNDDPQSTKRLARRAFEPLNADYMRTFKHFFTLNINQGCN